jgi:hypothetical protein
MTPAETKQELVRRMRAKDLEGSMALIADDAVYFWSNGSAMFGKPAIAEAMKSNFEIIQDDTYDIFDLTWVGRRLRLSLRVDRTRRRRARERAGTRRIGAQKGGRRVAHRSREPQPGRLEAGLTNPRPTL